MSRHSRDGTPATGDGRRGTPANLPRKTQVTQKNDNGTTLPKTTAKLWGIFSDKKGRKP